MDKKFGSAPKFHASSRFAAISRSLISEMITNFLECRLRCDNSGSISKQECGENFRIMIDLTSVSHALTVAERGSFNRAAHTLGVRQSAVSQSADPGA